MSCAKVDSPVLWTFCYFVEYLASSTSSSSYSSYRSFVSHSSLDAVFVFFYGVAESTLRQRGTKRDRLCPRQHQWWSFVSSIFQLSQKQQRQHLWLNIGTRGKENLKTFRIESSVCFFSKSLILIFVKHFPKKKLGINVSARSL